MLLRLAMSGSIASQFEQGRSAYIRRCSRDRQDFLYIPRFLGNHLIAVEKIETTIVKESAVKMETLRDLFEIELLYAYDCEEKLVKKGLPAMIENCGSSSSGKRSSST